jgi:predicted extracellular nuclease
MRLSRLLSLGLLSAALFIHHVPTFAQPPAACIDPATPIHTIQGTGTASPLAGQTDVIVQGVVVGDFQGRTSLEGFFLQEEDSEADANPATSEGLFIYDRAFGVEVNMGDVVRVQGDIIEFETGRDASGTPVSLTEMTRVDSVVVCSSGQLIIPAPVDLPLSAPGDLERYEGMRVTFTDQLTVVETFELGRFGTVTLAPTRLYQPTQIARPGAQANAILRGGELSKIVLDDGNLQQNRDPIFFPQPGGLASGNPLRQGFTVDNLTGVLEQRLGRYRVQPTDPISFFPRSQRTFTPEPTNGRLTIASYNVLNYFNGDGAGNFAINPRGANSATEFDRQQRKLFAALRALDADIIGLMEIENDAEPNSALTALVEGLNAAIGSEEYTAIETGPIGPSGEEIRVAFIYRPAVVTPVGDFMTDVNSVWSRQPLAVTFRENDTGEVFSVIVNHFKSKRCDGNATGGNADSGDGQACYNAQRTDQAERLLTFITDTVIPTAGDPDVLIIGDLNSYAQEDPIVVLREGGFENLIESRIGSEAYSFVRDGYGGYLDYALASPSLTAQITGLTEWHINADEPTVTDYNMENKSATQQGLLYLPDPFRSSDHDPVLVGLSLDDGAVVPTEIALLPTETPIPPTATRRPTNTPRPPTNTPMPLPTNTARPSSTPRPPTATPLPTNTPVPPSATPRPSSTPRPPTATLVSPTETPVPATVTPVPPTATLVTTIAPTEVPSTPTRVPTSTLDGSGEATRVPPSTTAAPSTPTLVPRATFTPGPAGELPGGANDGLVAIVLVVVAAILGALGFISQRGRQGSSGSTSNRDR